MKEDEPPPMPEAPPRPIEPSPTDLSQYDTTTVPDGARICCCDPSTTPTGSFEPRPAGCDAPRTTLRPPTFSSIQQYSAVFSSIRQYTAIYPSIANYKPIMGQAICEYIGIYCCILQYIAEGSLRCLAAPRYTPIYPSIRLEDVPPISPYIAQ